MAEEASCQQGDCSASTTTSSSSISAAETASTPSQIRLRAAPHAHEPRALSHYTHAKDNRAVE